MLNFCTLFNSNYFSRGLAMYESLKKHCPSFHLYVFAFDDVTFNTLKELNLSSLTPILLSSFEDRELLKAKQTRSAGEYCWTCTPSTILYIIRNFKTDHCTYIDADLYFYSDPQVLIEEMGDSSVLITEHRFTPKYSYAAINGKYCVQFMTFKNTAEGMRVLNWWREACNRWCYSYIEDGKFGDQKYLDDWLTRFSGVHELQHLGGGVAPWNVQQYTFFKTDNKIQGREKLTGKTFDLIFYHFHALRFLEHEKIDLCDYTLSENVTNLLYRPYVKHLLKIKDKMKTIDPALHVNETYIPVKSWKLPLRLIKRRLTNNYNIYKLKNII